MDKVKMPVMRGPFATDITTSLPAGKWKTVSELIDNHIPIMTDPMGRYWDQPQREEIYVQHGKAYMSAAAAKKLQTYSHSFPSGVYVGKMWKRVMYNGDAYLLWFRHKTQPGTVCSQVIVDQRLIVITDKPDPYYLDEH
ncbi:MAG: hypothetical protein EOO39_00255 [Cytophagaceae bacterium]|nr:MAG: hypothetical protein EOO39_00255 [Cytophagaceae bacterium]